MKYYSFEILIIFGKYLKNVNYGENISFLSRLNYINPNLELILIILEINLLK